MSLGQPWIGLNCKALWHFEGNSLDATAGDHDGTDTDITYSLANGKFGQGAGFDGDSSKIALTDHADLKPTGSFTIGIWFKTSYSGEYQIILASLNAWPDGFRITADKTTGYITFISCRGTGSTPGVDYQLVVSSINITDGKWHFLVCLWDGSYLRIYIDGDLNNSNAWTYAPVYNATNYPMIGVERLGANYYYNFNGALDEVFLINGTAWTAQQVRRWYGHSVGKLQ